MVNPEHLIGKVIDGRYCLTRYIGSGTFGHVFEAIEKFMDDEVSRVAIKLIYPASEVELDAVRREIQGLARLRHDHVIAYQACGPQDDGLSAFVYVVTELAETSLSEFMRTLHTFADGELGAMPRGIASALAHIHEQGSVHRDVKPENIFRVQGQWKLGDFGFTRPVHGTRVHGSCLAGTPAYMPPEALRGEIGPPTGVYAFGKAQAAEKARRAVAEEIASVLVPQLRRSAPSRIALSVSGDDKLIVTALKRTLAGPREFKIAQVQEQGDATRLIVDSQIGTAALLAYMRGPCRRCGSACRPQPTDLLATGISLRGKRMGRSHLMPGILIALGFTTARLVQPAAAWAGDAGQDARQLVQDLTASESVKALRGQKLVLPELAVSDESDKALTASAKDFHASLQTALINSGFFKVVERSQLDRILKELNLELSDLSDPEQVQRVGKLANSDLILLGEVTKANGRTRLSLRLVSIGTGLAVRAVERVVDGAGDPETPSAAATPDPGSGDGADDRSPSVPPQPDNDTVGKQLRLSDNPRVMVVVPETLLGRPHVPDPAGETELIRRLLEAKLRVVESSDVASIRDSEQMGRIIDQADVGTMKALGAKYRCDILIAGEAFAEEIMDAPFPGFQSARARIEVKAFIVDTGEILAAHAESAGGMDLTPAVAGKKALQNAACLLAKYLVPRIKEGIIASTKVISVQIANLYSASQLDCLEATLRHIAGVETVQRRSFDAAAGMAALDVETNLKTAQLSKELIELREPLLIVKASSGQSLEAEVVRR